MSRVLAAAFAWWLAWDAWRPRRAAPSCSTLERMLDLMPDEFRKDDESLLYELMEPMAREMDRMHAAIGAGSLPFAGPPVAEDVGSVYGITRAPGESDENFRERLIRVCASPYGRELRGGRPLGSRHDLSLRVCAPSAWCADTVVSR